MPKVDACPKCGAALSAAEGACPSCGQVLTEVTASFPPVGGSVASLVDLEAADGPLLVVRKGPEVGERFYLDRASLTIGRDPASGIFLNDITVSRHHATLDLADGTVAIADAGSLNGTYVNGVSVDRAVLSTGDSVQVGRFQMVFLTGGGA
jgi:pSer/pThr/pTyr-binding forkhead associated (FHA) protein